MKKVDYKIVKNLADLTREYAATGDKELVRARFDAAEELSKELYGRDCWWCTLTDLFSAMCGIYPLKENFSDSRIIRVLKIFDIEVIKENEDGKQI